jgi:hypothetical protein
MKPTNGKITEAVMASEDRIQPSTNIDFQGRGVIDVLEFDTSETFQVEKSDDQCRITIPVKINQS